jgi:hypothetical protein
MLFCKTLSLAHQASKWNHLRSGRYARFKALQQLVDDQLAVACYNKNALTMNSTICWKQKIQGASATCLMAQLMQLMPLPAGGTNTSR